jgi:hypothetical protein
MYAPPKQRKHFPPSVKKGGRFDVPDGIIAHLTRECRGNLNDGHVIDKRDRISDSRLCGPTLSAAPTDLSSELYVSKSDGWAMKEQSVRQINGSAPQDAIFGAQFVGEENEVN